HRARLQAVARLAVLPFVPQARDREHRRSIAGSEIPGLLALRCVLPLVVARHGHEAAFLFEWLAEERFCRHRFDAGVEGSKTQFLEWLAPPEGHQAPTHLYQFALVVMLDNRIRWIGWAGVESRLKIRNR